MAAKMLITVPSMKGTLRHMPNSMVTTYLHPKGKNLNVFIFVLKLFIQKVREN